MVRERFESERTPMVVLSLLQKYRLCPNHLGADTGSNY
jgi:hypothetical protein